MGETSDFINQAATVLFGVSWLILFYLAWPRLLRIGRNFLRKRSSGKPIKLTVPPVRPKWDLILEKSLGWATALFLGLSLVELIVRRPQFERYSLPLFGICLGLMLLVRWWRKHFRNSLEKGEIFFPYVLDNTAIGMSLLKVQEWLEKLRHIAAKLNRAGSVYREVASQLLEFIEDVRIFLVKIRLEPSDSALLRKAQPLFIHMETLVDAFELLTCLADEEELRRISNEVIEVLINAKQEFAALQVEQSLKLQDQIDILIAVLRHLYKPSISESQ
jgi:hypothetical protein